MARFIGSKPQGENWGEDYFIKKLIEYFDDSYVIYRNRPVYGAQFDVCLFAPKIGIIIFEVKAWKSDTIKKVRNGDSIVIKTIDEDTGIEGEAKENPTTQVRGYVYKMRNKIRQKTGKTPLVYGMVCFLNLSKADYDAKGIEPVCEYEETILKEDLVSKAAFFSKMNLSMKNHKDALKFSSAFTPELMFRVRQIFECDLKLEDQSIEDTDSVETVEMPDKSAYSIFAYIPHDEQAKSYIEALSKAYSSGTKLYLVVKHKRELEQIKQVINSVIRSKGLISEGLDLKIDFSGNKEKEKIDVKDSYTVFNCSAYTVPQMEESVRYSMVTNGEVDTKDKEKVLEFADRFSNFNNEQFRVEHCNIKKNIIVRAGAGTGKTHTMISRIAYICHMQNCAMKEMANRIVMITFTDDAANQMEQKIKRHFNNYYLLTGDTDCLAFINQIEGMQICTIHSYAKKIISQLGIEFGYGTEISVISGEYKWKQIIAETVDRYIVENQKKRGNDYVKKLGMPVYQINKSILNMFTRLHNQSVDVASLDAANFGSAVSGSENGELHDLLSAVVPEVEKEANTIFRKDNKVHLSNMMSILESCISNENNRDRLIKLQTGRPQFMFVDEFQDTDDVQIGVLVKIAELLQYRLFVVGDVKQCIYRFRGAKENAFEQLHYKNNPMWEPFSLSKNYRTDKRLLDFYHNSFAAMGDETIGSEQLLIYGSSESQEGGRLIGTRSYNSSHPVEEFYKKISILNEDERLSVLFDEVKRQKKLIEDIEKKNGKRMSDKEREIAILVRENWQAEIIKKEGKPRGINVVTKTGGDLYMSEPALDMLTLANALLHYDEADYLYAFVASNFIDGGMSKAKMYYIRENENKNRWKKSKSMDTSQTAALQKIINMKLCEAEESDWRDWNSIIKALRTVPVLQVLRKVYQMLKPWMNYEKNSGMEPYNYRLNVELLFEELINTANMDSVSINSVVDILLANIISQKNVDSRELDSDETDEIIVKCVTVHKAKGLEYGAVILPFCSASINVMKRTDMNVLIIDDDSIKVGYQIKFEADHMKTVFQNDFFNEDLEKNERMREEARILYVAMTRAIRSFSWIALDNKQNRCWQNLIWEG